MLVDRRDGKRRVLVGKRGSDHAFMPNLYVFPGGRRDRSDSRQPFLHDLDPTVLAKLSNELRGANALVRARALAIAAIRELAEETGLVIGRREIAGNRSPRLHADLSSLRYVARAITPPGYVRRFDTRFFLTFTDETDIDPTAVTDSPELHDLRWLDMDDLSGLNMPGITKTILEEVKAQMMQDPTLPFGASLPFYYSRRGQHIREII
jgi:NTP pyrophosphohydrolases including oxidative damage repair enzymes